MKRNILILSLLVFPFTTHATSVLFTLSEKLERACVIARITVAQVVKPSDTANPMSYCVIKAKIKELFKGEGETTVDFRSHMYAHLEVETLADLVGKDFLIFLHDPYKNKEYWLFQGPMGMRPIQENYSEWRLDDKGKPVTVTYTHEEYMRILRTELQQKKK